MELTIPIPDRIDSTGSGPGFRVKNPVGTVKVDNVEKLLDSNKIYENHNREKLKNPLGLV